MSNAIPIYRDHSRRYQADTCAPVRRALASGELRSQALAHGHYPGKRLPQGVLAAVKSVGYWDTDHDQDWGLATHRNEGVEFTFLASGSLGYAVEGCEYTLEPDDLTICQPWQEHRVGLPHVTRGRLYFLIVDVGVRGPRQNWKWPPWVVLSQPDLAEVTGLMRRNKQPVWKATMAMRRCFQAIGHAVESDQNGSAVSHLTVRLNEFFLLLLEMLRRPNARLVQPHSGSCPTVERLLEDLRACPEKLGSDWTVDGMAAACGLGATQFIYHVKRLTNMPPAQYLNHCRLERAGKLLLERPEESITSIALACGFYSSQYFATLFRRRFGRSPHEVRACAAQAVA
ncbi:MAG TPA: AraC family transcriptional regulator [Bryobacteraceae bacterium]|nr:AraC family transcriptional regulator [Bryobacteraceae bacterium]